MKLKLALLSVIATTVAAALFSNCTKSTSYDCDARQMEKFNCTITDTGRATKAYHYLGRGIYKGQTVYFKETNCVVMICEMVPPAFGVTCEGDTVNFEKFSDVTNQVEVSRCDYFDLVPAN